MKTSLIKILCEIFLVVGIFFLILSPTLGFIFPTTTLIDEKPKKLDVDSKDNVKDCLNIKFSLEPQDKCHVEFFVPYEDMTVTFIFVKKHIFETHKENEEDPDNIGSSERCPFLRTTFSHHRIGVTPSPSGTGDDLHSITLDEYYFIEFMGGGNTGNNQIWSEFGEYVLIIWGDCATPGEDKVKFDVKVTINRPDEQTKTYADVFFILGVILILAAVVMAIIISKKR